MGLLERASMVSRQRGYDYYIGDNVKSINKTGDNEYEAVVRGSGNATYSVKIDTEHTTKSKCNCPHADGRRIVCKHMIAVCFTMFPEMAREYEKKMREVAVEREIVEESIREYERERRQKIVAYVNSMSIAELREALIDALMRHGEYEDDEYGDYDDDYDEDEYW